MNLLIGREEELKFLDSVLDELINKNKGKLILLWGTPGVGKTSLLLEFFKKNKKRGVVYLQAKNFFLLPPDIGGEIFIKQLLSQLSEVSLNSLNEWYTIRKDDYAAQIKFILSFPLTLAEERKKFLIWDDFHLIFKLQKNYAPKNHFIEEFIKNWQNKSYSNLTIIFTSHWQHLFFNFIKKGILDYNLKPLSKTHSYQLIDKFIPNLKEEEKNTLYELTAGIPFYIRTILEKKLKKDVSIEEILEEELTYPSQLLLFLNSVVEEDLHLARGGPLAYAILEKLAEFYPLSKEVKELTTHLHRDYPVIREMLRRLKLSDLVEFINGKYKLKYPIFAFLFKHMKYNPQVEEAKEELVELVSLLFSTSGGNLPKELFGNPEAIEIPYFQRVKFEEGLKATLFSKKEVAKPQKEELWILKIKWSEEPVEEDELIDLLNEKKLKQLKLPYGEVKLFCLSKSGYSTSAILLAKEEGILVAIPEDINLLKILMKE